MQIVNKTPFVFLPLNPKGPEHRMTLILKGTFDLKPGQACTPASTQLPLSGDKPFLDDIGRSLAWATDLTSFKPHTDFYVIGTFHQPGGQPAPEGHASITLGPLHKELAIRGPRVAIQQPDKTWAVSPPTPIKSVPLRWEYSFGGLTDRRNPMGMGIDPLDMPDGTKAVRLPLIEHPAHLIRTMKDRPPPANFAPVPPSFQQRRQKLGTRDRHWAVFQAPLPPKDYDPSYQNAAPNDQQAGNYPTGDEVMTLRNLHPSLPELTTRLPGLRTRVGLLRNAPDGVTADEVAMHIDTVIALPDSDHLVLLWRGVTTLRTDRTPDEILLFQIEMEPTTAPPAVPSLPQRMLAEYNAKQAQEAEQEQAEIAKTLGEVRKLLTKANLPPELTKTLETETDPQKLYDLLDSHLTTIIADIKQNFPEIAAKLTIPWPE